MDNVTNILNAVLEARGWRSRVLERLAVEIWPDVVGEWISPHTIAESFRNGTLHVRTRSPQWTHELHFHEARIITRLNGRLGQSLVQKIRCHVTAPPGVPKARLKKDWEDPTFPPAPTRTRAQLEKLNDEALQYARDLTSSIEDEEVRTALTSCVAAVTRAQALQEPPQEPSGPSPTVPGAQPVGRGAEPNPDTTD